MAHRLQKQTIIFLATLVLLASLSFSIYAIWPQKVPVDSEPNGDFPKLMDIEFLSAEILEVKPGVYDVFAHIKNPNPEHGASSVGYEFRMLNSSEKEIYKSSGKTFIMPGEDRFVVVPAIRTDTQPRRIEFDIKNISWEKLRPFSSRGLALRNTSLSRTANSTIFEGVVVNATPFNLQDVEVQVMLSGEDGNALAIGETNLQTLLRDTERFFRITWPQVLPAGLDIDDRVESNFLENSNFIREFGIPQEF